MSHDADLNDQLHALAGFPARPQRLLVVSISRSACSACGANITADPARAIHCSTCCENFDAVALLAWTDTERGLHQTLPHVYPELFWDHLRPLMLTWHRDATPYAFEEIAFAPE